MCNYLWDINVKTVNRLLPYSTSCVPATIDSFFLYDVGMKKERNRKGYHTDLHVYRRALGRDKTIERVCSRFYWGKEDIKHYISTCDTCQRASSESLKQSYILHDGKLTSCSLHVGQSSEQYRRGTETGCQPSCRACMTMHAAYT